ncbi:MAG: hypothetical protein KF765_12675 [Parvibaculaceae bacterium]|nr:hypothetical protein [Parvibaculaceae bacterium]
MAMLCAAPAARAGGWPLPRGEGEVIFTYSSHRADERYENSGNKRWTSSYTKHEISPYAEYGLFDRVTLVGEAAWREESTNYFGYRFEDRGFSRAKAGARVSLGTWEETLFSLQSIATLHLADAGDDPAATRSGDWDAEIGLVLARNEKLFGLDAFSVQEFAWRWRDSGRPDQIRSDITIGTKFTPGTMLLLKSLNTASIGATETGEYYLSGKIAVSLVQELPPSIAPGASIEAGIEQTAFGRSAIDETVFRLALWRRF